MSLLFVFFSPLWLPSQSLAIIALPSAFNPIASCHFVSKADVGLIILIWTCLSDWRIARAAHWSVLP